ncbi:MAG: hypothetical protein WC702_03460 [Patescibacteria group bacterium]|jgi:hypothetical protein
MFSIPTLILPLWLLLIPFGIIVFLVILYGIFNIYTLLRFATYTFGSYFLTVVFIGGLIIIGAVCYTYLIGYDWTLGWNFTNFIELKQIVTL